MKGKNKSPSHSKIIYNASKFCTNYKEIENYDKMMNDVGTYWECHHRLETHNSDGERMTTQITREELKALGMYYNRPASELIFLTRSEHCSLHQIGKDRTASEETKKKISNSVRNNPDAMGSKAKRMRKAFLIDNKGLSWNEFQHKFKEIY